MNLTLVPKGGLVCSSEQAISNGAISLTTGGSAVRGTVGNGEALTRGAKK